MDNVRPRRYLYGSIGRWLDIPEESAACYGVLPPFKTIEIHPCLRPLREDLGAGPGNWICGRSQGSPRALQGSCTDRYRLRNDPRSRTLDQPLSPGSVDFCVFLAFFCVKTVALQALLTLPQQRLHYSPRLLPIPPTESTSCSRTLHTDTVITLVTDDTVKVAILWLCGPAAECPVPGRAHHANSVLVPSRACTCFTRVLSFSDKPKRATRPSARRPPPASVDRRRGSLGSGSSPGG
eukprot:scaffold46115_cov66-Phaeocystis_antarctica.AAC.7